MAIDKTSSSPQAYKPGTLRKIKLQNFMCHEQYAQEFGPRVNFIIGPNGSGKSAVLTAIVVVLGGRATTTSRAKKASDFVQYGKKFARIVLEIQNYDKNLDQNKAFKREEYGKFIIIEKIIYKDDQSGKLILKNSDGKRVSERKQELDEILDHFSIYINNPICVLNQEVSKSFLHSKRPEDKFELFMKATNLEQIESDYHEAKALQLDWNDCNKRKAFAFKLIEDERTKCKEKLNFLENRIRLEAKLTKLNIELTWALRRDLELKAEDLEKQLKKNEETTEQGAVKIDGSQRKISDSESRVSQLKARVDSIRAECDESKKKVATLRKEELDIKSGRIGVSLSLEQEHRKLTRLEKDQADLIKTIENIKGQLNNKDSATENEKRKLEMEQLTRETTLLSAKEVALRQRAEQIHHSMTDIKHQISAAVGKTSSLRSDLQMCEANLRSLMTSGTNSLRKFGPHMQRIVDAVNEAHKQGRFSKKPLGPLGYYIKVKNPKVASALELNLGKNAWCFTCDNHRDMLALQTIFRNIRTSSADIHFREPPIFVRRYARRHDVSKNKPIHGTHKSMIDHLEISEDAVFNALVDRTSIESVMFIPEYNDARNIMITPSLVPQGTRSAYTEDCHMMHPRTSRGGFRSIALSTQRLNYLFTPGNEEQIRSKKQDIERLKVELRSAEEREAALKRSDRTQRAEYDSTIAECERILRELRPMEVRLLELKTTLAEDQPQELMVFETELESCIVRIREAKTTIAELEHKLSSIDLELKEKSLEIESAVKVLSLKEKEINELNDGISKEKELIKQHTDTIKEIESAMKDAGRVRDVLTKDLDAIKVEMEMHSEHVRESVRPTEIRSTDIIQDDIKKTKRSLSVEIEDNLDPRELMDRYRQRITEIAEVYDLRDLNLKNFHMTEKSLKDREEGFNLLRKNVCGSVSLVFASVMESMGMKGELTINFDDRYINGNLVAKAKTLEMSIDTGKNSGHATQRPMVDANISVEDDRRGTRSQPNLSDNGGGPRLKRPRLTTSPSEKENHKMTDTRSLSGGERSFSTVAFVLSLWHHCQTPFKLMDEIDVFMDMVTRRMSYNALINFAKKPENDGQFIYFSPLELPQIDNPDNLVRVFEMPRIIRHGTQ